MVHEGEIEYETLGYFTYKSPLFLQIIQSVHREHNRQRQGERGTFQKQLLFLQSSCKSRSEQSIKIIINNISLMNMFVYLFIQVQFVLEEVQRYRNIPHLDVTHTIPRLEVNITVWRLHFIHQNGHL